MPDHVECPRCKNVFTSPIRAKIYKVRLHAPNSRLGYPCGSRQLFLDILDFQARNELVIKISIPRDGEKDNDENDADSCDSTIITDDDVYENDEDNGNV